MRRQFVSSLLALLVVLAACVAIGPPAAHSAPGPTTADLLAARPAPGSAVEARGFPAKVKWMYDHGNKPFVEKMQRDGSWRVYSHATGKELPKVAVSTLYPTIGPYWNTLRWRDAANGHPSVCVQERPFMGDVNSKHPVASVSHAWSISDFKVIWHQDVIIGEQNCMGYSDYYKLTLDARGTDPHSCNYNLITPTTNGTNLVRRAISYFSEGAFDGTCFDLAEENVWRTTTVMGAAFGLEWHHGSGAPSPFGGTLDYLWPQPYDLRTLAWYN